MSAETKSPQAIDPERLTAFVATLCKLKSEAVQGRKGSGIEEDWIEDEEHYQGIDDANRAYSRSWLANIKAGATAEAPSTTSVAFLNVTRPVVDTGAAKVADILLPTDDRCWAIKPTPIPDLDQATLDQLPALGLDPAVMQQKVAAAQESADKAAAAMQKEIDDLFTESNWQGEVRMVIEDAARLGSGVLKGPFPKKTKRKKFKLSPVGAALEVEFETRAASRWVSLWNFFPDPACGENIHNGAYTWERDFITDRTLQGLIGQPGYNDEQIREALKEGPKGHQQTDTSKPTQTNRGQYELWTFYGQVKSEDLRAAGMDPKDIPPEDTPMDSLALLVNDRLIKVAFNAMDTGEFPYDVLAWQRRPGLPWGTGISRHARTPQRMLNAGVRQMLDNGALSCAPQYVIANGVKPADGKLEIHGRKGWLIEPDGPQDARAAMASFAVQSVQAECMGIINLAMQMVEETTGMPSILSGQEPDRKETLGQAQMRVNNASGVMRRLAKRFDDYVTKPHVRRYYDFLMQHSDKKEIKGDFEVDVRASSALVEKDAQLQYMNAMLPFAKDPAYGMSPYHLVKEITKSNRMDPKLIQVPEDQYQGSQGQPSPIDAAKVKLMEAQAAQTIAGQDKAKAEAAKTRGDTMFATISAAKEIALNPAIAPVADQIGGSIGLEDQNASPLVAPVEGVPASPEMPENTSPNFPPRANVPMPDGTQPQMPAPPHADTGARLGIEGGGE